MLPSCLTPFVNVVNREWCGYSRRKILVVDGASAKNVSISPGNLCALDENYIGGEFSGCTIQAISGSSSLVLTSKKLTIPFLGRNKTVGVKPFNHPENHLKARFSIFKDLSV
jgi:hypothetical protein